MSNCGTCRHWDHPRMDFGQVVESRSPVTPESLAAADLEDVAYGKCQAIPLGPVQPPATPLAVAMDASQYQADLFTKAEFGCRLWEGE